MQVAFCLFVIITGSKIHKTGTNLPKNGKFLLLPCGYCPNMAWQCSYYTGILQAYPFNAGY
ncbi:hypothetical protein C7N43_23330 [Sphingobacteriales bacterium UPWRP_1]|nr:hypothetical protein BVG80_07475 [Sphingobacteriales bacterium TSM_CSM]PSJ74576.1 hypothetical protein C7N43_23330 [Sphingobacteriales bacterium UPWRP_1]